MRAKLSLKSSPCLALSLSNSYHDKQKTKLVKRNSNITNVTKIGKGLISTHHLFISSEN